jgi:hypothetical protein
VKRPTSCCRCSADAEDCSATAATSPMLVSICVVYGEHADEQQPEGERAEADRQPHGESKVRKNCIEPVNPFQ